MYFFLIKVKKTYYITAQNSLDYTSRRQVLKEGSNYTDGIHAKYCSQKTKRNTFCLANNSGALARVRNSFTLAVYNLHGYIISFFHLY